MQIPTSKAINFLTKNNISFELFTHTRRINSLIDAAEQRGQSIDQVLRSILFRNKNHDYFMVITTGSKRIDWKKLRNYLGVNRTALATEIEVLSETGYQLGTVNPFNINTEIRVLINETCLDQSIISIGSGIPGIAIIMTISNLKKALPDSIIVDFSD